MGQRLNSVFTLDDQTAERSVRLAMHSWETGVVSQALPSAWVQRWHNNDYVAAPENLNQDEQKAQETYK